MDVEEGTEERELMRERIAREHGFALYRHYNETEAATFMDVHAVTLKKLRLAGKIAFLRKGERSISYFGFQVADYLIDSIQQAETQPWNRPEPKPSKSETTSSARGTAAPSGTAAGTTNQPDANSALRLAQQSLKKPKKP